MRRNDPSIPGLITCPVCQREFPVVANVARALWLHERSESHVNAAIGDSIGAMAASIGIALGAVCGCFTANGACWAPVGVCPNRAPRPAPVLYACGHTDAASRYAFCPRCDAQVLDHASWVNATWRKTRGIDCPRVEYRAVPETCPACLAR